MGPPFTVTIKAGKPKPAKIKGPKKTAAERVGLKSKPAKKTFTVLP